MIKKSDPTKAYNCFGFAHNKCEDKWYEPYPENEPYPIQGIVPYWPSNIKRDYTLDSFIALYENIGFQKCASEENEIGFLKIALLLDRLGEPIHATFQNDEGKWVSKLGYEEDVIHSLEEIIDYYKKMDKMINMGVVFMKRQI